MRPEHLQYLLEDADYQQNLSLLVGHLAMGHVHPEVMTHLRSAQIAPKPKGDSFRPLLVSNVLRRVAIKALMIAEKENVTHLTDHKQYGVGAADGASKLTKLLRTWADREPHTYIISLDIFAAFQTISRASVAGNLGDHRRVAAAFRAWYPHGSTVMHRLQLADGSFHMVPANQGVDQGDPLASYCYSKGGEGALDAIERDLKARHPGNRVLAYLDDTYIKCRAQDIEQAIQVATHHFAKTNQRLQPTKIKIWTPTPSHHDPSAALPPQYRQYLVPQLKCLGAHLRVAGDDTNTSIELTEPTHPFHDPMRKLVRLTANIRSLQEHGLKRQTAITLLQAYTGSATQHVIRNYFVTDTQAREWDSQVLTSWSQLIGKPLVANALARLPRREAGVACTDAEHRHDAALWSAWTGAIAHIISHTNLRNTHHFLEECPTLARDLETTQQGIARTTAQETLQHQPLHTTLNHDVKQKQLMELVHKHTIAKHIETLTQTQKAQYLSRGGPGAGSFLTAPPDPDDTMDDDKFSTAVATRLGTPWSAHSTPPTTIPSCPNITAGGAVCGQPLDADGLHACLCGTGGGVIKRHDAVLRALAGLITRVTGAAVQIERRTTELRRIFRGRIQEGQMDILTTDFTGSRLYIDVTIVSSVVAHAHHLAQAANKPSYAAMRAEFGKRQRYPTDNILPFAMEIGGRPGPSALRFIRQLFRTPGADRTLQIADAWSTLSTALHGAVATQLNKSFTSQPAPPAPAPDTHARGDAHA